MARWALPLFCAVLLLASTCEAKVSLVTATARLAVPRVVTGAGAGTDAAASSPWQRWHWLSSTLCITLAPPLLRFVSRPAAGLLGAWLPVAALTPLLAEEKEEV